MLTSSWALNFRKALNAYARHKPMEGVKSLQKALETCPPSRTHDLYRIFFYLGIGLRRLGYSQTAIKSWISCQRLNKRGYGKEMLARFTNCYGMERQPSAESDDWQAFLAIHTARYLLNKNKRTFSTAAEQDMIRDLIWDSWDELAQKKPLNGESGCQKLELFRGVRIVFPSIVAAEPATGEPVIAVNFQTHKRVELTDRCSCGSGLPFIMCCGRTPGKEELLSGIF